MVNYFVSEVLKNSIKCQGLDFGVFSDFVDEDRVLSIVSEKFSIDDCKLKICELLFGKQLDSYTGLVVEL